RGLRFLVGQHLGVGQATESVDGDVHDLPTDLQATDPVAVGALRATIPSDPGDAMPSTTMDPAELLRIDMNDLARPEDFERSCWLQPEPAQPAESLPLEHPRNGGAGHRHQLGDLRPREP